MVINQLPDSNLADRPTGCCPRFKPDNWENQRLQFDQKLFVETQARSILYIPLNFGKMMTDVQAAIQEAGAEPDDSYFILSRDLSPWKSVHLLEVSKPVAGYKMVNLSGDFLCKVYEGPFKDMRKWIDATEQHLKSHQLQSKQQWMFYTTCPKCAKYYGKNYVVSVTQLI